MVNFAAFRRFYREVRTDFWLSVVALIGVVATDVLSGLLVAVFLSVVLVVYRASRPYLAVLGKVPNQRGNYTSLERNPDNEKIPGLLILRLDAPLFFANANVARSHVLAVLAACDPPPKAILFDIGASYTLDITCLDMLSSLVSELREAQIEILLSNVRGPARDKLRLSGLMDRIGEEHIYLSIDSGVQDFLKHHQP